MEVNQLVAHYKANYEHKVFMTRLSHAMQNAYINYDLGTTVVSTNIVDDFFAAVWYNLIIDQRSGVCRC